jgi:hypothetical protein
MGALMICPVCKFELGVERRADEVVLTYSFVEWAAVCPSRALVDPVLCDHLLPTILAQLPKSTDPRTKEG